MSPGKRHASGDGLNPALGITAVSVISTLKLHILSSPVCGLDSGRERPT